MPPMRARSPRTNTRGRKRPPVRSVPIHPPSPQCPRVQVMPLPSGWSRLLDSSAFLHFSGNPVVSLRARSDDFEPVYPTGSPQPINDQIKHPRMPDVGAASSETWTLLCASKGIISIYTSRSSGLSLVVKRALFRVAPHSNPSGHCRIGEDR